MLRKSLQNYAKVKAASSHSRDSSDYASCKENVPIHTQFASVRSQQSVCKASSDKTPTSRFDHTKAISYAPRPDGPSKRDLSLTPLSSSVNSTKGTPILFPSSKSLGLFGSPTLSSQQLVQTSSTENIKVVIRVRPTCDTDTDAVDCVRLSSSDSVTLLGGPEDITFGYDHVAGPQTTQEQFFRVVGRPMVENVLSGYNSCIFAYGQTGSGKTHTMLGQLHPELLATAASMPEQAGLIPRIFTYLFHRIEQVQNEQREGREVRFICRCSFLEIYKEVITDLLNPAATRLQIREDFKRGVHVEGLQEDITSSAQEVLQLLSKGSQNRHVAATKANSDSSRSHCVFSCVLESKCIEDGATSIRTSCLKLVDLAGSERQKVTEGEGERLKEAGSINRSLTSLGLVIKKLVEGSGPAAPASQPAHIPYRDSRLTFLLQDSLGGNAKTVMVATISPGAACAKETASTLGFAHRAKMIKNKAVVNEDTTADALLLQKENERLRKELDMFRQLQQACTPTPPRRQNTPLAVVQVSQEAELAEAEVQAVWAGQLATALDMNQDLEDTVLTLRQQNTNLTRERRMMEGEVRQTQADMQALVEADLEAQRRAQAAEAEAKKIKVYSQQQQASLAQLQSELLSRPTIHEFRNSASQKCTTDDSDASRQLLSQIASLQTQIANGDIHTAELKKKLADSDNQSHQLATAAQQLQQSLQDQKQLLHAAQHGEQAAMQERDALRHKVEQQKAEMAQANTTISELQEAAASLADELHSVRSAAGIQPGPDTALQGVPAEHAEHAACSAELAAKSEAVDSLNATVTQLRAQLVASTSQQAQSDQDSTNQQAEFVGQVLQELQLLETALLQKGEECESLSQQYAILRAESNKQVEDHRAEHSAQTGAMQQMWRQLKAQHEELTDRVLALDAQAAYKKHKLDALQKEVATAKQSQERLQAELEEAKQQVSLRQQTAEASTSTSEHALFECVPATTAQPEVSADRGQARKDLKAEKVQLAASTEQTAEHRQISEDPLFDSKVHAEDATAAALQASADCVHSLEAQVANLQNELSVSADHGAGLQQQLDAHLHEVDTCQTALENSQRDVVALQQRLADAENAAASAQHEQHQNPLQAAADKQLLVELQQQLFVAQEDRAALLLVPDMDVAAPPSKLEQAQQEVQTLKATLADQSSELQRLQAAAWSAHADNSRLLSQLEAAQGAVAAAEQRVEQLSNEEHAAAAATQQQLEQDRDSLMEEVLNVKARTADQERIIQSLRAAAGASAREKALLSNQLDATEQQFASQAQELLQQQLETQRLHAALKDQRVQLKKAQFKGSSNDQGLRGMQQQLQEALQDKRAAELSEQNMQTRLQEAEQALTQAAQEKMESACNVTLCPGGTAHQHALKVNSHQVWTGQLTSVHPQRTQAETQTEASASQQGPHEQCEVFEVEQQLSDAHVQAEKSFEQQQRTIAALETQLAAQVTAFQEAQHAAQHAQQALLDLQTEVSSQRTQLEAALQDQVKLVQQQQADLQQSAGKLSDLTQHLAETTQSCSELSEQLTNEKQQSLNIAAELKRSELINSSQQSLITDLEQRVGSSSNAQDVLQLSLESLKSEMAAVKAEGTAKAEEMAVLQDQNTESKALCSRLSKEMEQLAQGSATSVQLLQTQLNEQAQECKKLQQQLQEAEEAAGSHKAAAEQLQYVLNAAQAGSAQLSQRTESLTQQLSAEADIHSAKVTQLQQQAADLTQQLKALEQAHEAESAQQLKAQTEAHSAELARVSAEHARAESRVEQLLTELQAAQQSCQALLRQAAETEAAATSLRAEMQQLRSSLQDRDDLILDLDTQIKALEGQMSAAFAEHEAKLGQQQEALARQSQKGIATLQARIKALQATLASDSSQHAAAYRDLQQQHERLQRDKEAALNKVASLQKQTHMGAAKAVANDQAVAALQQDLASWQARYKRKDAELAAHTSKVAGMQEQQQQVQQALAEAAGARSKAADAAKAMAQAQHELHQLHEAYRRRDGEVQRWRGLANQARAEGQALQAKRDEEAALYGEQVQEAAQKLQELEQKLQHDDNKSSRSPLVQQRLADLVQERDDALALIDLVAGQVKEARAEHVPTALLHEQQIRMSNEKQAAVQAVQDQLDQANVEHAAVMSRLRALHSAALEEVRRLRQQQSRPQSQQML